MATLSSKKFGTIVGDFAAAAQGASRKLVDFTIGSILLAAAEATAACGLWLQGLCYQVLAATRLATSSGADVDSFGADYGLTRLAAVAATGLATFSRSTPTLAAVVPVGAQVATSDGTQKFLVYADTANAAYSPTAATGGVPGYIIGAGVASGAFPVRAINSGIQGNVTAGTLTLLQTGISGVDTASNASPFINGIDAESDPAFRSRFVLYIASLARSTAAAIGFGLASLQQGLQWTITENQQYAGAQDNGYLTIVVDDGSGVPPSTLLAAAALAVDAYRAAGVRFGVFPPVLIGATVSFTITTAPGYPHAVLVAATAAAVAAYINGLGLGNPLRWSRLEQVIYDISPGITNVSSLLVNTGTSDIVATPLQTVKTVSVTAA